MCLIYMWKYVKIYLNHLCVLCIAICVKINMAIILRLTSPQEMTIISGSIFKGGENGPLSHAQNTLKDRFVWHGDKK